MDARRVAAKEPPAVESGGDGGRTESSADSGEPCGTVLLRADEWWAPTPAGAEPTRASRDVVWAMYCDLLSLERGGALDCTQRLKLAELHLKFEELHMHARVGHAKLQLGMRKADAAARGNDILEAKLEVARESKSLRQAALEAQKDAERAREAGAALSDSLYAGLTVHLAVILLGSAHLGGFRAAHSRCMQEPNSGVRFLLWRAGMGAAASALQSLCCWAGPAAKHLSTFAVTAATGCWLLRSGSLENASRRPFATMALLLGVVQGCVGKAAVDAAGGRGSAWACLWAVWTTLHLLDALEPLWPARMGAWAGFPRAFWHAYRLLKVFAIPLLAGRAAFGASMSELAWRLLGWAWPV